MTLVTDRNILDDRLIRWITVVIVVHDYIDASI